MTRLVLGSSSSGRLKVLRQAGIEPLVVVSGVDEDAIAERLGPTATPAEVTTVLAAAKADEVARRITAADAVAAADCVIVGCDSMLLFEGELRGKPGTADVARRQWQQIAGRSGELFTGHCLIHLRDGVEVARESDHSATTVRFGSPSPDDLDAYVRSGEPTVVAGAFTIDGLGGWFVEGVDGDPSSVIGIGLPLVRRLLARMGLSVAQFWAPPAGSADQR